jgi:hypothetical protein
MLAIYMPVDPKADMLKILCQPFIILVVTEAPPMFLCLTSFVTVKKSGFVTFVAYTS